MVMNLFDKHAIEGFVIVCQCGVDTFATVEEATAEGWTELIADEPCPAMSESESIWDYVGVCPECTEEQ